MPDQKFERDKIWENITKDKRFPAAEPRNRFSLLFRLGFLLLFFCCCGYIFVNHIVKEKDLNAELVTINQKTKTDSNDETLVPEKLKLTNTVIDDAVQIDEAKFKPSSDQVVINEQTQIIKEKTGILSQGIALNEITTNESIKGFENISNLSFGKISNQDSEIDTYENKGPKTNFMPRDEVKNYANSNLNLKSNSLNEQVLANERSPFDSMMALGVKNLLSQELTSLFPKIEPNFNLNSTTNLADKKRPFYIDIAAGLGATTIRRIPNSLQLSNFENSNHLQLGVGFRKNNWEFELGVNLDILKSSIDTQTVEIKYVVNESSNRLEKLEVTNNYLLYQYYSNAMLNVGLAKRLPLGSFVLSPKVKLRYSVLNLSRGSLLDDTTMLVQDMDEKISLQNRFSFEAGLKLSLKKIAIFNPYLELVHSRNTNFLIEGNGELILQNTFIKLGVNYSL